METDTGFVRTILLVTGQRQVTEGVGRLLAELGSVITVEAVDLAGLPPCRPDTIVYDVDIDTLPALRSIKARLSRPELDTVPRILVTDRDDLRNVALNALLKVSDVVEKPVTMEKLLHVFQKGAVASYEGTLEGRPLAVKTGLSGLNSLFGRMLASHADAPDWAEVTSASNAAVDAVRQASLDGWLDLVEQHHSATLRHCLSVTGIAVAFAQQLGFTTAEQQEIARAAVLHDIGKAAIPLAILDKPGPLTLDERKVMQTHPRIGHAMLIDQPDVTAATGDMVLHHHELLDGSGYPDGLGGSEITPAVRLMTIADIFSALIEKRSYKAVYDRPDAYDILLSMDGLLDAELVRAFAPVALGSRHAPEARRRMSG